MSEAVRLLTHYLFDTRKVNRIQLVIHPENGASRRVAEGTMRGAWYHRSQYHDVAIYALLRNEYSAHRNEDMAQLVYHG